MEGVKTKVLEFADVADKYLNFLGFTGRSLREWMEPFVSAMRDDGALSYLIVGESLGRFRASPLSSAIIWLNSAGLLSDDANRILRDKLIFLRDNVEQQDPEVKHVQKKIEDIPGWSLSEGVSVWSTSMALIALIGGADVGLERAADYRDSILWLVDQKKTVGLGWGYQSWKNCEENVIMTSLALHAIALAYKHSAEFGFQNSEKEKIESALISGFKYLRDKVIFSKNRTEVYWDFMGRKHCAATIWSLIALKEMADLELQEEVRKEIAQFYSRVRQKGLRFVIRRMPKKPERWEDEQIVNEGGAKYAKQKNYYSFSATILMDLFELGISPYHKKVAGQISWLLGHEKEWKITEYDIDNPCSFTYAMVVATIARWASMTGTENARRILQKSGNILEKMSEKVFGVPSFKGTDMQVISRSRLALVWSVSLVIVLLAARGHDIYLGLEAIVVWLFARFGQSLDAIVINIISTALYAFLHFLGVGIFTFIVARFGRERHG